MSAKAYLWAKVPHPDAGRNDKMLVFDSADDMWRLGDEDAPGFPGGETERSSRSGSSDFTGTKSWEEAYEMGAKTGWPEGAQKMRKIRQRVNAIRLSLAGSSKKRIVAPSGSRVHVPRLLAGDIKHMERFKRRRTGDGTHVKIGVECTVMCNITQKQIINRGVACSALIKAVEDMGISVELIGISSAEMRDGGHHSTVIRIKRAGSYMNDERIAFTLAHPATLRRGVFAGNELWGDKFDDIVGWGYGTNGTTPESTLEYLGIDVCLPMLHNDSFSWSDPDDAQIVGWVNSRLDDIAKKKNIKTV